MYCLGSDVHNCRRYTVAINRNVLPIEIPDLLTAIAVLFASHYVFNLQYEPGCVATLEYIQRWGHLLFLFDLCIYHSDNDAFTNGKSIFRSLRSKMKVMK